MIGLEPLSFLCDRMFKSMDKNNEGYVIEFIVGLTLVIDYVGSIFKLY
jgi:hypothetical protein